jgi:hypothetical protein
MRLRQFPGATEKKISIRAELDPVQIRPRSLGDVQYFRRVFHPAAGNSPGNLSVANLLRGVRYQKNGMISAAGNQDHFSEPSFNNFRKVFFGLSMP